MSTAPIPIVFGCENEDLLGILHPADSGSSIGVVIVVGGPQYRVGSHRQFVLLSRRFSESGTPVFRFDCRGMGDSSGESASFVEFHPDLSAAIDEFMLAQPNLRGVVLWGLCDGASAALLYGFRDERVVGQILVNPWARSEAGLAKAYLRHYYLKRLFSGAFWKRLVTGRLNIFRTAGSLIETVTAAVRVQRGDEPATDTGQPDFFDETNFTDGMLQGLERFRHPVLFVLSGDDITAAEFEDLARSSRRWRRAMKSSHVSIKRLPEADHTFSRELWRNQLADHTQEWLNSP